MAKLFRLVVDTDSYAGNFERELCAYVTGQIGECGVGEDVAKCFSEHIAHLEWWDKHIVQRSKPRPDPSCKRPVTIYQDAKTGKYTSVAIYVKKMPPDNVMIEFAERVSEYCNNQDLIKAQTHNMKVSNVQFASLMSLMGMNSQKIDLTTMVKDAEPIAVSGIRIFEGLKDEVLVAEMPFNQSAT
jgi:hypothetical protein